MKSKRERERELCKVALPMLDLPPSTTREGNTVYQRTKRDLEKLAGQNPENLRDFLLHYEANKQELLNALKQDCLGWFRKKKKE